MKACDRHRCVQAAHCVDRRQVCSVENETRALEANWTPLRYGTTIQMPGCNYKALWHPARGNLSYWIQPEKWNIAVLTIIQAADPEWTAV